MKNLILRDFYYNKICSSIFCPNKLRRYLYNLGGRNLRKESISHQGVLSVESTFI